ncbi:hypothetical protein FOL46_000765 [Perkinsus olseni]|uniref:Uncharacterized protein n=1 Tax=Perkinsus olseni TaxID=32597 RepID=A0A7J6KU33_PEROL|nr:hypothetical protein FOL46_000765 [Perkinsus olseni]
MILNIIIILFNNGIVDHPQNHHCGNFLLPINPPFIIIYDNDTTIIRWCWWWLLLLAIIVSSSSSSTSPCYCVIKSTMTLKIPAIDNSRLASQMSSSVRHNHHHHGNDNDESGAQCNREDDDYDVMLLMYLAGRDAGLVVSTLYDHHHVLLSSSTSSAATGNNIGSSIEDYWKHRDYIINNTEKMVLDAIGYDTSSYTDNAATLLQVVINYASSSSAFYSSSSSYPCIVSTAILLCDEIIVNNILYNNIYSNNIIHNADNSRHNSNKYRVWVIALAAVHLAVVATSAAANSNNAKYNNNIKDKHDDDDKGRKDNNAIPLHIQRALDDLQGGKESVDVDDDGGVNLSFSSLSSSRPVRHDGDDRESVSNDTSFYFQSIVGCVLDGAPRFKHSLTNALKTLYNSAAAAATPTTL